MRMRNLIIEIYLIAAIIVLLVLVMGCEKPQVEKPRPELDLSRGKALIDQAIRRIQSGECEAALQDVQMAAIYFDDGLTKTQTLARVNREEVSGLEKQVDKLSGQQKFRGMLYASAAFGALAIPFGAVLMYLTLKKWGGALLIGGVVTVVTMLTVGESLPYAWIVALTAACVLALGVIAASIYGAVVGIRYARDMVTQTHRMKDVFNRPNGSMSVGTIAAASQEPSTVAINTAVRKKLNLLGDTLDVTRAK